MNLRIFLSAAILPAMAHAAHANPVSRQATITGIGGSGRCSIEVSVDHAAEIEISGVNGLLTTIAGQPSAWRRFQCNAPLPRNPVDFRLVRRDGRGTARLVQDPRASGGRAVIQINDPQGGRANYAFDLQWRGRSHAPGAGGFPMTRAIGACQDSVTDRLNQQGYSYVAFGRTFPDQDSGQHVWIMGTASAQREFGNRRFSFSCSVDAESGRVRLVDVRRK